jgi:RNA polymerase sigma-70 factor (ECF subfamily)
MSRESTFARCTSSAASMTAFEDSALIERALAGQSECFAVLADRHLPQVRRRIGSLVMNSTDVDDVVQEVLVKVWLHLASFRAESSFRTWMTRIAIHEVLLSYRRGRRSRLSRTIGPFDSFASPDPSPHQSLVQEEVALAVRKAVAGLPNKYKRVLVLRDLEQFSIEEIAQRMEATIATVKTRLFRARRMLQRSQLRNWAARPN